MAGGTFATLGGSAAKPAAASSPNVGAVLSDIMKAAQPAQAAAPTSYWTDKNGNVINVSGAAPPGATRHSGAPPTATAAPQAGAAGTYTNTAQKNPTLSKAIDLTQQRIAGDLGAKRAIDVSSGQIREAAIGGEKALEEDAARRGVTGTGVDKALGSRYSAGTNALIAKNAANIAEGREDSRDQLISSLGSMGATEAGVGQADRSLALDQQRAIDAQQAQQQAARDQQMQFLISSLLQFNPNGY